METFGNFLVIKIPEEVWEELFSYFHMTTDRYSLCSSALASTTWNKVLHKHKQLILFDQVLPQVIAYIGQASFWNCRKVCASWCHDIDHFLENHPGHRKNNERMTIIPKYSVTLHRPDRVRQIAHQIRGHARNPFPGRSLTFKLMWRSRNAMISILEEFGSQVWFLHLDIYESPLALAEFVEECTRRTPNLKALDIDGEVISDSFNFADGFSTDFEQAAELILLIQYLRSVHFTHLPNLETLQIRIFNEVLKIVISGLLFGVARLRSYSTQLKKLRLDVDCISELGTFLPRCGQLTDLEVVLKSFFPTFHESPLFSSPLQKLTLDISEEFRGDWNIIPNILNRLSQTLEEFYLRLPASLTGGVPGNWRFDNVTLPNLKTLVVFNCFSVSRGIAISAMKSLECLHVKYTAAEDRGLQRLQLAACFGGLVLGQVGVQNSLMWQLFKKLKVFTHSQDGGEERLEYCSREMYEYLEKLKNDF